MSQWADRILKDIPADLARLWIVADPDGVLLDEQVLLGLRERGFEVLPFSDGIAFRAEYEQRYRAAWDKGEQGPSPALILQFPGADTSQLPWDYLRQGRRLSLSLANLFPKLSYTVVRQLGNDLLPTLFEAQAKYAQQNLGDTATKEFVLTHLFRVNPYLIMRAEDLWAALLRLHFQELALPPILAQHIANVLIGRDVFKKLPLVDLFASKAIALKVIQEAWARHLAKLGVSGTRTAEPTPADYTATAEIPFDHPDVRSYIDSMFLDGTLHPLMVQSMPAGIPEWVRVGVVQDPAALRNLVGEGIKTLLVDIPAAAANHRDWTHFARRLGEVLARFHALDSARAEGIKEAMRELQSAADEALRVWVTQHYADLPSLPPAKAPVMVHHVPRFLSTRRGNGEDKVALLVFDGLAVDQWTQIREALVGTSSKWSFDEGACFAWLPTLTSVSRQALFSGLRPREFPQSIETTAQEPALWTRFWQDHGLRANEVVYRKSIKRTEDLADVEALITKPAVRAAGLVVDTVDEIVHGAVLGKRGIARLITDWCQSGFVERLFRMLLDNGFHIYVTADHGNVEAEGVGRPSQGLSPELRGERVRTYRTEALAAESAGANAQAYRLDVAGLPANFMPLFASGRGAFVPQGDQVVVHGGVSVEELIVPFVKVSYSD